MVTSALQAIRSLAAATAEHREITEAETWMFDVFQAQEIERAQRMQEAWRAYYGELPDAFRKMPDLPNDNIYVNFSKVVVNKTVAFLFGKPVDFLIEGESRNAPTELNKPRIPLPEEFPLPGGDERGEETGDEAGRRQSPSGPTGVSRTATSPTGPADPSNRRETSGASGPTGPTNLFGRSGTTGPNGGDRPTDRPGGVGPDGEGEGETEDHRSPAQQYLDDVWDDNNKKVFLQKLAQNGAVCGHAFAKIIIKGGKPRLKVLDPANVSAYSTDDDFENVFAYKVQWNGFDRRVDPTTGLRRNRPAVFRQIIQVNEEEEDGTPKSWTITDMISKNDPSTWMTGAQRRGVANTLSSLASQAGWEVLESEPWPYPFAPIVDCQNLIAANEYYGLPDLDDDVIELQKSINLIASNTNRIIRIYAHPKAWTAGMSPEQVAEINASPSGLINLPDSEMKLQLLEMQSDLQSSDVFYGRMLEAFHELTQVPEIVTGKLEDVGNIAGVALQILYSPLDELTEKKRDTFGGLLRELNRRILWIGGFQAESEKKIHIEWPEVIPTDPLAEAQTAQIQKAIGVSKKTLIKKMGYDAEAELNQAADEALRASEQQALGMAQMGAVMPPGEEGAEENGRGTGGGFAPGLRGRRRTGQQKADSDGDGIFDEASLKAPPKR